MNSSSSYNDFATVYDRLTSDVEYEKRCDYLEDIFAKHMSFKPSLVADLGCGTGSVCSILSSRGYDCIGIDSSEAMLDAAVKKNADGKVLYLNQDMCEFELYGTVDAFLCMLDSLNYVTSSDEVGEIFSLVHNYLNPGGLFVFDVNTFFKYDSILSDNTFVFEENDVFCTWENCFDGEFCDFRLNFFVKDNASYRRLCEEHTQRYHSHEEIVSLLEANGLSLEAVYSELSFELPKDDVQRIFYVAKKR